MTNFAFLLKSYSKDIKYVKNLIHSYNIFNSSKIILYLIVPNHELKLFSVFSSSTIVILPEESIPVSYFQKEVDGISAGYLNQQIVKLAFWKLGLCDNYMCLDSEAVFLRNFGIDDFLTPTGLPYTVLIEDRDRQCDPEYYNAQWRERSSSLLKIQEFLGFDKRMVLQTCHGFQIFSSSILKQMENEILTVNGLTLIDLLEISPYEFSWYNYFLQKLDIRIYPREPFFKVYDSPRQLIRDQVTNVSLEDLARGYLGIVVNSNLSKNREKPISFAPFELKHLLGRFVPLPTLLASLLLGSKRIPAIITQRILRKIID
jgi:hypothetical protein